jgi:hypothetical protein
MAARINLVDNIDKIRDYLLYKSDSMSDYIMKNQNDDFLLLVKPISHSDLTSSGKRTKPEQPFSKNYLYYVTADEMEDMDRINKRPFVTAHQSNIGIPKNIIYEYLGVTDPDETGNEHFLLNDYCDVYLVNDTLKYFDIEYSFKVFEKLNKVPNWNKEDYKITLVDDFTPIKLSIAAHGIGVSANTEFDKLRRSIFKSDTLILLLTKNKDGKIKIFIMLEKNPSFFTLIGEGNKSWEKYLEKNNKQELFDLLKQDKLSTRELEKTRNNQSKWRTLLAEEMMGYTPNENEIFCPLTYITINYDNAGTLFRASHIKGFAECDVNEAFDINNGIIMIATADALFDKHLITIDDDGTVIFSFLLDNDYKLKQELRLTEKVFKAILNDERKSYLEYHRNVFKSKEILRRKSTTLIDDSSDEEQL